MSFFAVLLALVIEQLRPLPQGTPVHEALVNWARWTARNFDAGREHHAWVVWCVAVLVPSTLVGLVYVALHHYSILLALVWDLAVLYLSLGFRQFSHYYTDIRDALDRGREDEARELLREWRHLDASELPREELLRHVIEHALLAAHRHVFGVFFWFVLGSAMGVGPMGAVCYRMAEFCARHWGRKNPALNAPTHEGLAQRSQLGFVLIDHVPARLTAAGFAVVGNFEEAVGCWRQHAGLWAQGNDGVLLAAAAGATGIALGGQQAPDYGPMSSFDAGRTFEAAGTPPGLDAQGSTPGAAPQLGHLRSVVGLVWRSVVLWMLLLALLTLANLLG
jgi:adenosylcobinamide-phosphate synthase